MALLARQDTAFYVATDGDLQPLDAGSVIVYDIGGVTSSGQNTTTVNLYAGHGIAIGDCIMVNTDTAKFRLVTGSASTSITVNAAVNVGIGDLIVNLGTDTAGGSGTPNYDGSTVLIYDRPQTGGPITSSAVTIDAEGNYIYWFPSDVPTWELILDSDGAPASILIRDSSVLLSSTGTPFVDNAIARWDGTGGLLIQSAYSSNTPTIGDTGAVAMPGTVATGALTVTGAATVSTTLGVTGISTFGNVIQPSSDDTKDIGVASTGRWRNLYLSGVASVGGALSALNTLTVTGLTTMANVICGPHLDASVGSAPSTVSNIGNNWGSTSAATFSADSNDTRFEVTVTTSGSTFANPATLTIPFTSSWTTAPIGVVTPNNKGTGTVAGVGISWSTSTSAITIIFYAVPVTAKTYIFNVILLG